MTLIAVRLSNCRARPARQNDRTSLAILPPDAAIDRGRIEMQARLNLCVVHFS